MNSIKAGDRVILKSHPEIKWTVSYVEGNKIYCYCIGTDANVSSIVADASLLKHAPANS